MTRRLHPAWSVAAVAFVALIGAAGFRSAPGVLIEPLQDEFGWSTATIGAAVSVNLVLFGLTAPFAAALMERFGIRKVTAFALLMISLGSGLTVFMRQSWQLIVCWGVLVGLGAGSMALAFVATVTSRWFVKHRGVVTGILTAASATGQLIFLTFIASLTQAQGWRIATLVISATALLVVPLVLWRLRDDPADLGVTALGAEAADGVPTGGSGGGAARRALTALRDASRSGAFWLLVGGFAICGMTTNGLIGTHFIPAAHDHGMPITTAANLLALVGLFDIVGTVLSGWLTDRFDSRVLLGAYYLLRGLSLLILPGFFGAQAHPSMLVFIIFYGLDWVATVPPTIALCREQFGVSGPIVFGWVFASHQIGAAVAAFGAGAVRDSLGSYNAAFYVAGALSVGAAGLSMAIRRPGTVRQWRVALPA
ncbi:MFS family permease [Allocatelliglobosispora scoriae]|uniref:MFS family permease n=1 Tax=Allocatelliglobosispora scoriae TaxID=643052 RepID=A0A841BIU5_9ACTN|nr:MFS transporter [Allocatelliglobosispora scoriae]MBB5869037.1 MFS family permease [Allocatelliglobosispora scoriae]